MIQEELKYMQRSLENISDSLHEMNKRGTLREERIIARNSNADGCSNIASFLLGIGLVALYIHGCVVKPIQGELKTIHENLENNPKYELRLSDEQLKQLKGYSTEAEDNN
jgi:hypothetical protein